MRHHLSKQPRRFPDLEMLIVDFRGTRWSQSHAIDHEATRMANSRYPSSPVSKIAPACQVYLVSRSSKGQCRSRNTHSKMGTLSCAMMARIDLFIWYTATFPPFRFVACAVVLVLTFSIGQPVGNEGRKTDSRWPKRNMICTPGNASRNKALLVR